LGSSLNPPIIPHWGQWLASLFTLQYNETSQVYQDFIMPNGQAYLNFFYYTVSAEPLCDVGYWDSFSIYFVRNNAVQLAGRELICDYYATNAWTYSWVNITALGYLPGQAVRVVFEATTSYGDAGMSVVFLDDISINSTHGAADRNLASP